MQSVVLAMIIVVHAGLKIDSVKVETNRYSIKEKLRPRAQPGGPRGLK